MNDATIRSRIREALEESPEPAGLAAGVEARLHRGGGERHDGQLRAVAAGLGLILLAGLGAFWFGQRLTAAPRPVHQVIASPVPAAVPSASPPASSSAAPVPAADVAAARLGATAVPTPIGTTITSGGVAVTLLGVYADSEQTVLFFHEEPAIGVIQPWGLADEKGDLNAAGSSGIGLAGDYWMDVAAGLRSDPGTTAKGSFVIRGLRPSGATADSAVGNWRFEFSVPLQLADQLAVEQTEFQAGSWRVLIQSFLATPASLHLSALITGAAPGALGRDGLTLTDPAGKVLDPSLSTSAVTVPKQALNPANSQNSIVSVFWPRPADGGDYKLHFAGNGTSHDLRVLVVPATASGQGGGKAAPSAVGSFPADLTLSGPVSGHIDSVAVSLCAGGMPGSDTGYRTVLRAPVAGTVVTIQLAVFARDYTGPGTYPTYRDFGNGGGEGVTVSVEGGDYYAQTPSTGGAGNFTIGPGGGSGTFESVRLKGNSGGELSLTGSWSCR